VVASRKSLRRKERSRCLIRSSRPPTNQSSVAQPQA
jgi:hypothetical protein